MLRFINHISAEEYWFNGVCTSVESLGGYRPLALSGTFMQSSGLLLFEGTYRYAAGNVSHPFEFQVLSHQIAGAVVRLRCSHLGTLSGRVFVLGDEYQLLLSSTSGHALSAHVALTSNAGLRAEGAVLGEGVAFGFTAHGGPGEDRSELGNVVRVSGGRRA